MLLYTVYIIYLNILVVWTIVYGGCSTTYEANHHDVIPVYSTYS